MNKPLHPVGTHVMRLVNVNKSKYGPLGAQCIFEGTGENKKFYTISRFISRFGRWAETSEGFLEQLNGFNFEADLKEEIGRFIGQEFVCVIPKMGKNGQMNISRFKRIEPNINGNSLSLDEAFPGNLYESR